MFKLERMFCSTLYIYIKGGRVFSENLNGGLVKFLKLNCDRTDNQKIKKRSHKRATQTIFP